MLTSNLVWKQPFWAAFCFRHYCLIIFPDYWRFDFADCNSQRVLLWTSAFILVGSTDNLFQMLVRISPHQKANNFAATLSPLDQIIDNFSKNLSSLRLLCIALLNIYQTIVIYSNVLFLQLQRHCLSPQRYLRIRP